MIDSWCYTPEQIERGILYGGICIDQRGHDIKHQYYEAHPDVPYESVLMSEVLAWYNRGKRDHKSYDEYGKQGEL